jgi:hypothetical protein
MRLGLLVVMVLVASPAWAEVLCQSKRGALSVRTACKKKETLVDPAALGLQGPPGPPGPAGTAGAYGSFSNDSGSIVAVVLGGTSIPLSTTTASLNISYTGTTATIANAGVYRMSYCVRTTATTSMSSRLLVNGAGVTSSAISPPQGSDKFCRSTTLSLAAGTTVDLQLYANPPVAATLLSPGGAEMLIEMLGPLVP